MNDRDELVRGGQGRSGEDVGEAAVGCVFVFVVAVVAWLLAGLALIASWW
jgi:hypothetical protein